MTSPATYDQAIHALFSLGKELASPRQPALSAAQGARVQKFGLENISALAEALGRPHLAVPCVHIAGTNGKGSTAAMLESILRAAGLRTGLYTSPHLESINERIRFDGQNISDEDFAAAWSTVHSAIESLLAAGKLAAHPTFFECITAMAFVAFASHKVDFAIYEVGLGGRFDATNIVQPAIAVITAIDFDHENFLGNSIELIASEKAGIIKRGTPVISAAQRPEAQAVIREQCAKMNARLVETDSAYRVQDLQDRDGLYSANTIAADPQHPRTLKLAPHLPGEFQIRNALTAVAAASLLTRRGLAIDSAAIERGIATARWPGRLERLAENPALYVDGTHNPSGARELEKFWRDNFRGRKIFLVYGAMRDKAVDEIAGSLFPHADTVILTEPRQPRAISATLLNEMTGHLAQKIEIVPDPAAALERAIALAGPEDAVFVTGSLYLVGDLLSYWHRTRPAVVPKQSWP
ncbi:MAG TPA: folylpolyglutamate synthase/dihydrofolate synthase family protein [Candidatus Acidoferrales bacterium]